MNQDQVNSLIRNLVTAVAGVIASFNITGDALMSELSALTIAVAMLVWGLFDSSNRPIVTLTRKVIQAAAPVLVTLSILTPDQGASFTALAFVLVTTWSSIEKNKPK